MNKYFSLIRTLLINSYAPLATGKASRLKALALLALVVISLIPWIAMVVMLISKLYAPMAAIGQEGVILGLGCALSSLMIFFFGIFYVINVFYFAQDIDLLLPLPLKPWHILGAKFAVTLIFEYLTQLLILAPLLITYGVMSAAGVNFYFLAAVVFMVLPVVPLVLAALLAMVLMSLLPIARNKDTFRIWAGSLGLFLALGFNFILQKSFGKMKPEEIIALLQSGKNSMVQLVTRLFPGIHWGVAALLQKGALTGWGYAVLFMLLAVVVLTALLLLGNRFYFRGAMGGSESHAEKRAVNTADMEKFKTSQSLFRALLLKEWRLLIRTPAYFMNCVLVNFMWPLIFLFAVVSGSTDQLSQLRAFLGENTPLEIYILLALGVGLFTGGMNGTSATGLSREGAQFYFSKSLPADYRVQITAKIAIAFVLSFCGFVALIGALAWMLKIDFAAVALALTGASLGNFLAAQTGMLFDIHFPKLIWDNEYKAVKQSWSLILNMLVCSGLGIGTILLAIHYREMAWTLVLLLTAAMVAANVVLYRILQTAAPRWLSRIEI